MLIGVPIVYKVARIPVTCHDGKQNQRETSVDRGGLCLLLDESSLQPHAILWARSFRVRDGSYNAVAYIQNPNESAGVASANYLFSLYDSQNVLIAERVGTTYIMPGGITPVFTGNIDTGKRIVAHTYFVFTDPSLTWERMSNPTGPITVNSTKVSTADTLSQVSAIVGNTSVKDIQDVSFVVVVFDTTGNAINASGTRVARVISGEDVHIGFTWPEIFSLVVGHIDIIPLLAPVPDPTKER